MVKKQKNNKIFAIQPFNVDSKLALTFGNVFANHIKLQIDLVSGLELVEVGVLVGIRDNGHTATVLGYIKNS